MKKEEIDSFEKAVAYLYNVPRFTAKNSPEDTKNFLRKLGNPDQMLHIIHVAGTNGKGSVCAYISSILRAAGKKTAVFTSPHLKDIRERFSIDGKMVEKQVFLDAFLTVYHFLDWEELIKGGGYHPTFFEYLFFMAVLIFAGVGPDYCIMETGLGGRLDATNAPSKKELTVITRIAFDHTRLLGNTIADIAGEKAGILRSGVPLIYSDTSEDAAKVFQNYAKKLQIPAFGVSKKDYALLKFKNKSIDFCLYTRYYGYIRLTLNTIAAYQMENAALAVRAIEILDSGHTITEAMIQKGVADCFWPGRMEEVLPEVYVDGAHNVDGIRAFLETIRKDGMDGRRRLLFGAVRDKDYGEMISLLIKEELFLSIAFVKLKTTRSALLESMEEIMQRYPGCAYTLYKDTRTALHELMTGSGRERLYIAGSLYLVGEIKEYLENDKF